MEGITTGNSSFIGIEAENTGARRPVACRADGRVPPRRGSDPEEDRREAIMACGHKEYALPKGRKPEPTFDMENSARRRRDIAGTAPPPVLIPAVDPGARPTLRRGARAPPWKELQAKLGIKADGIFGAGTEAAVREFQRGKVSCPTGSSGPRTWKLIAGG